MINVIFNKISVDLLIMESNLDNLGTNDISKYDTADNKNNGLITKIWGEAAWKFGHSVTFGYPIDPDDEKKKSYMSYFQLLGDVLPCKYCRESYKKFITEGDTILNDDVMQSRKTLTRWFYNVHEAVNRKLGVDYGVTYEDVVNRYESFRARCSVPTSVSITTKKPVIPIGCTAPLDYKANSYKKANQIDCPIFSIETITPFIRLARIRMIPKKYFDFYNLLKKENGDITKIKNTEKWVNRNAFCRKKIVKMREEGIPSIETYGNWIGLPSIEELKLLLHASSNLNKKELADCIRKLSLNTDYLESIESIY